MPRTMGANLLPMPNESDRMPLPHSESPESKSGINLLWRLAGDSKVLSYLRISLNKFDQSAFDYISITHEFTRTAAKVDLFSDAESGEDQIQDVV
jgi:hypothetical protein